MTVRVCCLIHSIFITADVEFEIQFNADSPLVDGDSVLLSFTSTRPVDEATCTVSGLGISLDCTFVLTYHF